MDGGECGVIGGKRIGRGTKVLGENLVQNKSKRTWSWNRTSWRLTAWAMARPPGQPATLVTALGACLKVKCRSTAGLFIPYEKGNSHQSWEYQCKLSINLPRKKKSLQTHADTILFFLLLVLVCGVHPHSLSAQLRFILFNLDGHIKCYITGLPWQTFFLEDVEYVCKSRHSVLTAVLSSLAYILCYGCREQWLYYAR